MYSIIFIDDEILVSQEKGGHQMIGEMLLGILIFFAIVAIIAGIMHWLTADFDDTFIATFILGTIAILVVEIFLPSNNIRTSLFLFSIALVFAFLFGLFILMLVDRFENAKIIAIVCAIVFWISSYSGGWYYYLCKTKQDPYSRNVVSIEEPIITETKYEILGGSDTTRNSGYVHYSCGAISEDSYFKVYIPYKNSDGETVVMPYTMRESTVTVIVMPNAEVGPEYLLQTVATYYKEDRNKEPAELIEDRKVVTNKLYVRESTFNGMKIDGD